MDYAGEFNLSTQKGEWSFKDNWTGLDSYLFIMQYDHEFNNIVWNSSVEDLLAHAPLNLHIFFGSYDAAYKPKINEIEQRLGQVLDSMSPELQEHWIDRLHFLDTGAGDIDGALGEFIQDKGSFWFTIDRFQRWREIGSLFDWIAYQQNKPQSEQYPMYFMANEAVRFNFEVTIQERMGEIDEHEIVLWDNEKHAGGWGGTHSSTREVIFPDAAQMEAYNAMSLYLYTACPDHLQGKDNGCNEWDYLMQLFICDYPSDETGPDGECQPEETMECQCEKPDGSVVPGTIPCSEGAWGQCSCPCNTEFARWVTSYGREGDWLTDITPMLSLVSGGGPKKFRFASANGYDVDMRIFLYNDGTAARPKTAKQLWGTGGGDSFNAQYNDSKTPITFTPPEGTTKVVLSALITGHGFGTTYDNCAEFCNHQHEFNINGGIHMKDHPMASSSYGCMEQVEDGTVANQYGTWIYGRGGWCPGLDVKPWTVDITNDLVSGENTIEYRGLFNGTTYDPVFNNDGYHPEIKMTSWLVFYTDFPTEQ